MSNQIDSACFRVLALGKGKKPMEPNPLHRQTSRYMEPRYHSCRLVWLHTHRRKGKSIRNNLGASSTGYQEIRNRGEKQKPVLCFRYNNLASLAKALDLVL